MDTREYQEYLAQQAHHAAMQQATLPLMFGKKYFGTRLCDVPVDYLEFLRDSQIKLIIVEGAWVEDTSIVKDYGSIIVKGGKRFDGKFIRDVAADKKYCDWLRTLDSKWAQGILFNVSKFNANTVQVPPQENLPAGYFLPRNTPSGMIASKLEVPTTTLDFDRLLGKRPDSCC